jgi:hypothetical protein
VVLKELGFVPVLPLPVVVPRAVVVAKALKVVVNPAVVNLVIVNPVVTQVDKALVVMLPEVNPLVVIPLVDSLLAVTPLVDNPLEATLLEDNLLVVLVTPREDNLLVVLDIQLEDNPLVVRATLLEVEIPVTLLEEEILVTLLEEILVTLLEEETLDTLPEEGTLAILLEEGILVTLLEEEILVTLLEEGTLVTLEEIPVVEATLAVVVVAAATLFKDKRESLSNLRLTAHVDTKLRRLIMRRKWNVRLQEQSRFNPSRQVLVRERLLSTREVLEEGESFSSNLSSFLLLLLLPRFSYFGLRDVNRNQAADRGEYISSSSSLRIISHHTKYLPRNQRFMSTGRLIEVLLFQKIFSFYFGDVCFPGSLFSILLPSPLPCNNIFSL